MGAAVGQRQAPPLSVCRFRSNVFGHESGYDQIPDRNLRGENVAPLDEIASAPMFEEIAGSSEALHRVLAHLTRVAPTDATVLITGESGTGKELIARALHKRSHRSRRPFVRVNCAAIPPSLIASELFGYLGRAARLRRSHSAVLRRGF
jgi:transcriptional regulator with PAS, ATPase and Fis domain